MRNALTLKNIQDKYGERVYPLYKEEMRAPYMEHPNGGLSGALLTDGEKVRCDICGLWFPSLGKHLSSKHKVSSQEYRIERGLGASTPLATPTVRNKYREAAKKNMNWKGRKQILSLSKRTLLTEEKVKRKAASIQGRKTDQYRNKFGLCQEQMALRYAILSIEHGKFIDPMSVLSLDKFLWNNIAKFYSNFPNFYKAIGIDPMETNWELPKGFAEQFDEKLISISRLRSINPDENGNFTEKTAREQLGDKYVDLTIETYGSWNSATIYSGINTV